MKNKKKLIFLIIISIIALVACVVGIYLYTNSNHLTINEKNWISEKVKTSSIINVDVINDSPVFGDNGEGLYYDFLNDLATEYSLTINKHAYNYGNVGNGVSLGIKKEVSESDKIFFTDHYVLVGKTFNNINNFSKLSGKSVGILSSDLSYVSGYLSEISINYNSYDDIDSLFTSFEKNEYIIIPLHQYLDLIIGNNYYVNYHFSDINLYYTLTTINDDTFSSIINKFFNNWKTNFDNYYNDSLFSLMTKKMNISETEIVAMQSLTYKYGFTNNSPYEVIYNGNYGGIAAIYLKGFSSFADVDFNFKKYRNYKSFVKAIAKNEVDIYFDYYNINNEFLKTDSGINAKYYVIANSKNSITVNSINALKGQTVYVDENSSLYTYLTSIQGINIITYKNTKELLKLNHRDVLILIDSNIFDYYANHGLENYTKRYLGSTEKIYGFKVKNDTAMYKLLNRYINIMAEDSVINKGMYDHNGISKVGVLLTSIAKYFILTIVVLAIIIFLFFKKSKKISIGVKIKKDDKLRFIDQLTMLKNRNFLTENISKWANNTIYPQAILIIDLNHLQKINDIEGYNEGDKQIKAAANSLIKTQLDNSEIIRTDGNEFVVYMVGYSQKQITNYIHKLMKEFDKLPYNYGAKFGYSMILDDIKTIEDALNEATKDLKKQKEENEDKR